MRVEKDSMGEMQVPDEALYGPSTQRAVLNFPISKLRFSRRFIQALGIVKLAAARSNAALGLLKGEKAAAIMSACQEVLSGAHDRQFPLDIFQTGSGTSTNMNANEVIANRAIELIGGKRGDKSQIHPNDDVNMCQSSNDVIPSCISISAAMAISQDLLPALDRLIKALGAKESEFKQVIKSGRTHLQDATPVTLGQEFGGYAAQIRSCRAGIERSLSRMYELALGGTAVGTGLNTHPDFAASAIKEIAKETGLPFVEASNHFAAQSAQDASVEISGQIRVLACGLMKIANDIRWLSAGPRCSLFEIQLPETQPGSSIMPAKVNPVICESVMMVAAHVCGNDGCVALAAQFGNFELNTMLPVIAHNLLESIEILSTAVNNFSQRCIEGITANTERCRQYAENSLATVTSLAPRIGYDAAAQVAKLAFKDNISVREAALKMKVMAPGELDKVLDLFNMTKPGL